MQIQAVVLRKVFHIGIALFFVALSYSVSVSVLMLCAVGMLGIFFFARAFNFFVAVRRAEHVSWGEYFFGVGVLLSALLFLPASHEAFVVSMLILGCTDTCASLVGRRFGRQKYIVCGEVRTLEGSLTAWFVSAGVLYAVGPFSWDTALAGGFVLAVVEAVSVRGSDNLFLPLVAGGLVLLEGVVAFGLV
jgi:phytol kinase